MYTHACSFSTNFISSYKSFLDFGKVDLKIKKFKHKYRRNSLQTVFKNAFVRIYVYNSNGSLYGKWRNYNLILIYLDDNYCEIFFYKKADLLL